jgi:uncharacterized protein
LPHGLVAHFAAFLMAATMALGLASVSRAEYPVLTGHVVDQADILSPAARGSCEKKLADFEQKTSIQIVVATVGSLGGQEIEPYATALFREWKLGQAIKNNGVLFLVAPHEHRVRIEVGFGLEETLTNATSKRILDEIVVPRLKAGDFDNGVARGVDEIIAVLTAAGSGENKKK